MGAKEAQERLACVALGSNLGEREATLRAALSTLGELPGTRLIAVSRLFETEPIGPPGQEAYLNAAARLGTTLDPRALLEHLHEVERRFGRARRERWGPRTLDLDLVLFEAELRDEPGLILPHPRLRERLFVLVPLAEVAASVVDPLTGKTVGQLLKELVTRNAGVEAPPRPI